MRTSIVNLLACPACKHHNLELTILESANDIIVDGLLTCESCRRWYPVLDAIPVLISDRGLYDELYDEFSKKWNIDATIDNNTMIASDNEVKQVEHYSSDSEVYDNLVTNSAFWRASDKNTIHKWIESISNNSLVLDMGCGTGRCAIPLDDAGMRVVACDISYQMVRKAVAKSGPDRRIDFMVADATKLPFREGIFDYVIGFGILHHVGNPKLVISNVSDVLVNNGTFFALENNKSMVRFIFDMLMRFDKLWNEAAGDSPLMDMNDVAKWAHDSHCKCDIVCSTFIPPHIFKLLNERAAYWLLTTTDKLFQKIPLIRNHGGQLIIHLTKANVNQA